MRLTGPRPRQIALGQGSLAGTLSSRDGGTKRKTGGVHPRCGATSSSHNPRRLPHLPIMRILSAITSRTGGLLSPLATRGSHEERCHIKDPLLIEYDIIHGYPRTVNSERARQSDYTDDACNTSRLALAAFLATNAEATSPNVFVVSELSPAPDSASNAFSSVA